MDPSEMLVKDPYAHVSILRAHLRPKLGQQLEAAPSSLESQPLPVGSCTLEPTEEAPGPKGAEAAASIQGQQAWQQPCTPYGSGQSQAGLTYAGLASMGLAPGPQGLLRGAPTRQARASAQVATAVPGQLEQPLACCHGCRLLPTLDSGTYPPRRLTAQPLPLKQSPGR
ncbi:cysteine-rich tail protein 1 [Phocoena phocoena]|uniref:cysteine-rich tail protein 1 n=1 Tax=Phocoena phocoena TaxID=9742 RepID=UPI0033070965